MASELRDERFTLRFTAADRALLDELARTLDVPAGTVLRWALRAYAEAKLGRRDADKSKRARR